MLQSDFPPNLPIIPLSSISVRSSLDCVDSLHLLQFLPLYSSVVYPPLNLFKVYSYVSTCSSELVSYWNPEYFVLKGQTCLLLHVSLDFLLSHPSPLWWKIHLFLVLVLEGLVDLQRTDQLQHQWLGHRLGLLWCWMVCLGNEQRSACRFWDCTQVLHWLQTLLLTVRATSFLLRDSCPQS